MCDHDKVVCCGERKQPPAVVVVPPLDPASQMALQNITQQQNIAYEKCQIRNTILDEQDRLRDGCLCYDVIGSLLDLAALVLLVVAYATNEWAIYTVNYPFNQLILNVNGTLAVTNNYICTVTDTLAGTGTCTMFYTRHLGLFTTYFNNAGFFPYAFYPNMYFGNYVWQQGYFLPTSSYAFLTNCDPTAFTTHTALMRTTWITLLIAMILLLFALISSLVSFCRSRVCCANTASVLSTLAFIMALVGMSTFMGYIYLENSVLLCPPYYAYLSKSFFTVLARATTFSYGYSMILGWSAVGAALLAAIFYWIFSCYRCEMREKLGRAKRRFMRLTKLQEKASKRCVVQQQIAFQNPLICQTKTVPNQFMQCPSLRNHMPSPCPSKCPSPCPSKCPSLCPSMCPSPCPSLRMSHSHTDHHHNHHHNQSNCHPNCNNIDKNQMMLNQMSHYQFGQNQSMQNQLAQYRMSQEHFIRNQGSPIAERKAFSQYDLPGYSPPPSPGPFSKASINVQAEDLVTSDDPYTVHLPTGNCRPPAYY